MWVFFLGHNMQDTKKENWVSEWHCLAFLWMPWRMPWKMPSKGNKKSMKSTTKEGEVCNPSVSSSSFDSRHLAFSSSILTTLFSFSTVLRSSYHELPFSYPTSNIENSTYLTLPSHPNHASDHPSLQCESIFHLSVSSCYFVLVPWYICTNAKLPNLFMWTLGSSF